jgi:hypothetical protein
MRIDRELVRPVVGDCVGGRVEVTTLPGYLPLQHDPAMLDIYGANAAALVGESNITQLGHRTGSTSARGRLSSVRCW